MNEEDKQLLLKDLCGRLPYGVIVDVSRVEEWKQLTLTPFILSNYYDDIEKIKPYLRPMSSMTEDEVNQYYKIRTGEDRDKSLGELDAELFNFYHKNHIDYRGLIPMGLALEASEGMYKTE